MEENSLALIKKDSIRKIFGCITEKADISRLEISEKTGLSLMTVGKIADALSDKKIIVSEKTTAKNVGRKAKNISLAPGAYFAVLDSLDDALTFSVYSSALEPVASVSELPDSFFPAIKLFLMESGLAGKILAIGALSDALARTSESELGIKSTAFCDEDLLAYTGMRLESPGRRILYIKNGTGYFADSLFAPPICGKINADSAGSVAEFLGADTVCVHKAKECTRYTRLGTAFLLRDRYITNE